jgi:RES domain-containing protein
MHSPTRSVFDATGSLYREGRWHSLGTRVIYAAEHISLAALELLIHAGGKKMPPRVVTRILIPFSVGVEKAMWMEMPASQDFGDRWVKEGRSLLLKVPSIAADKMEFNFVINPAHDDFHLISVDDSRPFHFDERFIHLQ